MSEQVYAAEGKIVRVAATENGSHAIVGIEMMVSGGSKMLQSVAIPQADINPTIAMLSTASGECLARRSDDPASIHVLPVAQWAVGHSTAPPMLVFRFLLSGGATLHLGLPAGATDQLIAAIRSAELNATGRPAGGAVQ